MLQFLPLIISWSVSCVPMEVGESNNDIPVHALPPCGQVNHRQCFMYLWFLYLLLHRHPIYITDRWNWHKTDSRVSILDEAVMLLYESEQPTSLSRRPDQKITLSVLRLDWSFGICCMMWGSRSSRAVREIKSLHGRQLILDALFVYKTVLTIQDTTV